MATPNPTTSVDNYSVSPCVLSLDQNAPKRGISGIYQVRNTLNGKRYIGSAQCFRVRWQLHLCLLRANKNACRYLQNAWNKYGENNFVFEVIEVVVGTKIEIVAREQFHMDMHHPEYNASRTAIVSGIEWTEERKAKMRKPKSAITKQRMSESIKRSYELNPALRQLRRDTFYAHKQANPDWNRGVNNGSYGKPINPGLLTPEMKKKRAEGVKRAYDEGCVRLRIRPVMQLDLEGNVIKLWPSLIAAAHSLGLKTAGGISNVCRGRWKTLHGFGWRYAGERS